MMLSGSLSSISKRLRNFIIRFTILLYYGELFDIPATKFFCYKIFLILLSLVVFNIFHGTYVVFYYIYRIKRRAQSRFFNIFQKYNIMKIVVNDRKATDESLKIKTKPWEGSGRKNTNNGHHNLIRPKQE